MMNIGCTGNSCTGFNENAYSATPSRNSSISNLSAPLNRTVTPPKRPAMLSRGVSPNRLLQNSQNKHRLNMIPLSTTTSPHSSPFKLAESQNIPINSQYLDNSGSQHLNTPNRLILNAQGSTNNGFLGGQKQQQNQPNLTAEIHESKGPRSLSQDGLVFSGQQNDFLNKLNQPGEEKNIQKSKLNQEDQTLKNSKFVINDENGIKHNNNIQPNNNNKQQQKYSQEGQLLGVSQSSKMMNEMRSEIDRLCEEVNEKHRQEQTFRMRCDKQREEFKQEMANMQKNLVNKEQTIQSQNEQMQRDKLKIDSLLKKIEHLQSAVNLVQQEASNQETNNTGMRDRFEKLVKINEGLINKNTKYQNDLEKMESFNQDLSAQNAKSQAQIQQIIQEIQIFQDKSEELTRLNEDLVLKNLALGNQLEQLHNEREATRAQLTRQNEEILKQLALQEEEFTRSREQMKQSAREAQELCGRYVKENEELHQNCDELKRQVQINQQQLKTESERLNWIISEQAQNLINSRKKADQLLAKYQKYKSKYLIMESTQLKDGNSNDSKEYQDLQAQLTSALGQLRECRQQLQYWKDKAESCEHDYSELEERLQASLSSNSTLNQNILKLQQVQRFSQSSTTEKENNLKNLKNSSIIKNQSNTETQRILFPFNENVNQSLH